MKVRKPEQETIKARLNELAEALDKIDIYEVIEVIREDRNSR